METGSSFVKLNPETTSAYLSAGGALESISEFYEERPSQVSLTGDICKVFNQNGIGVFEAGTGVGKSFAYLIPSMLWAINNNRVVISTGTINLQHQLIEKDIPLAKKIIDKDVKAVLVKGRQNYICKRRFFDALEEPDLFAEEDDELKQIEKWVKTTETGSKNDLTFMPAESTWQRINSESDGCMGAKCKYFEKCFVMKVRKIAGEANILVVNHHLLFADIEARLSGAGYDDAVVLPPYRRLIFDEAHGIENAATSFFSESITKFRFAKQLNMLYRQKKGAAAGHLFTLEALSSRDDLVNDVLASIQNIKATMQDLDAVALSVLDNNYTLRLSTKTEIMFNPIFIKFNKLQMEISEFSGFVRQIIEGIPEENRGVAAVWESKQMLRRIEDIGILCKNFSEWQEHEDKVFWIEKNIFSSSFSKKAGDSVYVRFVQTPLEIASKMNAGVFEPMDSVVCTSATLRTGNNFQYFMRRSGVAFAETDRVLLGNYESPFPYEKNAMLLIVSDAPNPSDFSFQSYVEHSIPRLISAAGGRSLVLFTSYDSLRKTWEVALNSSLCSGLKIYKQGDDDRFRLLENFKKDNTSVLFATDSFWEGIDVPGESLSQVIIVKLPFKVPSDPVFAARSEDVERRSGNPFMELSVPDAVIKFRQGFGRLMRRASDKGIVTVLDKRLYANKYGQIFINSIPKIKTKVITLDECEKEIERFL